MKLLMFVVPFLISRALTHGSHHEEVKQKPDSLSWQDWHMIEEHHMEEYDADSFFKLHDLQNKGTWSKPDILNVYGLLRESVVGDGSGMGEHSHQQETITEEAKEHVVKTILNLLDKNNNGEVCLQEWRDFNKQGNFLPDFGYGQGHHLDFESEYEEHHWNKYHANEDPDVLIKHKEDIEHELLHHEHEIEESHNLSPEIRKITNGYLSGIKMENVPLKYRRD